MKSPNQAPEAAPASAARPVVMRPVTCSSERRSRPTIWVCCTGKFASESLSTAACASGYVA